MTVNIVPASLPEYNVSGQDFTDRRHFRYAGARRGYATPVALLGRLGRSRRIFGAAAGQVGGGAGGDRIAVCWRRQEGMLMIIAVREDPHYSACGTDAKDQAALNRSTAGVRIAKA